MKFKLSVPTIAWALTILASAIFARQILSLLVSVGGKGMSYVLAYLFFAVACYIVVQLTRALNYKRIIIVICVAALGVGGSFLLELPEERVHLVEYAILGGLIYRDIGPAQKHAFAKSVLIGFLVGCADELLQWALPYRVGDMRDILFDTFGTLWGVLICRLLNAPR